MWSALLSQIFARFCVNTRRRCSTECGIRSIGVGVTADMAASFAGRQAGHEADGKSSLPFFRAGQSCSRLVIGRGPNRDLCFLKGQA
jgi:hypothetical protein